VRSSKEVQKGRLKGKRYLGGAYFGGTKTKNGGNKKEPLAKGSFL
jgi:hypothetical protein